MELTCNGSKHQEAYTWNYTGDRDAGMYVTCPRCYNKVKILDEE